MRRECLDHLLLLGETHLRRSLSEYIAYFNQDRPHQGRDQRVPAPGEPPGSALRNQGAITAFPVLGGLHTTYRRAA